MNKQEAIKALKEGKKITHTEFKKEAFLYMKSNSLYDHKGDFVSDFFVEPFKGKWNSGWKIFKQS